MDESRWVGEREIPFRVWAARRTVGQHTEPISDGVTGRCSDCPAAGEDDVCPRLRRAIRDLLDAATAAAG